MWKRRQKLKSRIDPFYIQRVPLTTAYEDRSRQDVFEDMCMGRQVLHIGFVGSAIASFEDNLHLYLETIAAHLDGVDTNISGFQSFYGHVKGQMYSDLAAVNGREYDIVLVPEVLEHVGDIKGFLRAVDRVKFQDIVITVPDAFSCRSQNFQRTGQESFVEIVHPDHNCWFSPYTITNVVRKYTSWEVVDVGLFNNISILLHAKKVALDKVRHEIWSDS